MGGCIVLRTSWYSVLDMSHRKDFLISDFEMTCFTFLMMVMLIIITKNNNATLLPLYKVVYCSNIGPVLCDVFLI